MWTRRCSASPAERPLAKPLVHGLGGQGVTPRVEVGLVRRNDGEAGIGLVEQAEQLAELDAVALYAEATALG
jgi:hypothetical protein